MNEMDVMRAMVRAGISGVNIYASIGVAAIQGKCQKHDAIGFRRDERFNVGWTKEAGWSGCAKCILTCSDILEDPDMPTESEELALRTELAPRREALFGGLALLAAVGSGFALGALLI